MARKRVKTSKRFPGPSRDRVPAGYVRHGTIACACRQCMEGYPVPWMQDWATLYHPADFDCGWNICPREPLAS